MDSEYSAETTQHPSIQVSSPTSGPRQRVLRTRPSDLQVRLDPAPQAPLDSKVGLLSKRQSRNSLIGFFGRARSVRAVASSPHLQVLAEGSSPSATDEFEPSLDGLKSPQHQTTGLASAILSPVSIQSQSSGTSRSRSIKSPRSLTSWDPPPLFQAYPQAVKHATLLAPTLDTSFFLKAQKITANAAAVDGQNNALAEDDEQEIDQKKHSDKSRRHRHRVSETMNKCDWVRKIFVLVTSGYLLQYAGDGTFDRLPEKMLRLSKSSAAFASDAIPGKPYVLQVSQSSTSDGEVAADSSRKLLSMLKFRSADARRSVTNVLLNFDTAEDMQSWLLGIRKEIESLGGIARPDSPSRPQAPPPDLVHKPSQRYLVIRDANRQSLVEPPTDRSKVLSFASSEQSLSETRPPTIRRQDRQRLSWAPTEAPSLSTTATSDVDDSREGRLSGASGINVHGQSFYDPSSPGSPTTGDFDFVLPELAPFDYPEVPFRTRQSSATTSVPEPEPQVSETDANLRSLPQNSKVLSPTTPNFSVPTFSHRFSSSCSSLPTIPNSRPTSSRDGPELGTANRGISTIEELPTPSTIVAPPLARRASRLSIEFVASISPSANEMAYEAEDTFSEDDTYAQSHSPPAAPVTARPKRLSSLQYARGVVPDAISPPPIVPLPPIPSEDWVDSKDDTENLESTTSLPNPQFSPRQPLRPISMQVHSPTHLAFSDYNASVASKRLSHQLNSVSVQDLSSSQHFNENLAVERAPSRGRILPRKSMPDLMSLGPPAPPPDCPLPALPGRLMSPNEPPVVLRTRQSLHMTRASWDSHGIDTPSDHIPDSSHLRTIIRADGPRLRASMM